MPKSQAFKGAARRSTSPQPSDRQTIRAELERRAAGQRLTPAQRRIAQCMIENSAQLGFLSSMELAELGNVSQPSVTRFAIALGFDGYLEMRRYLRSYLPNEEDGAEGKSNRYQAAAHAESTNLAELAQSLSNGDLIGRFGKALAESRPLAVLGLRASAGIATDFAYFASKVHPDVRLLASGGSLIEDQIEQCYAAGGRTLLAFLMPLYPREAVNAIAFARGVGMRVALISDAAFGSQGDAEDLVMTSPVNSRLVFDSYAAASFLVSVLLDAMCASMDGKRSGEAQKRLEWIDHSARKRKVFLR